MSAIRTSGRVALIMSSFAIRSPRPPPRLARWIFEQDQEEGLEFSEVHKAEAPDRASKFIQI
ncbi:MAG: hypothetical protein EBS53_19160 [Bacteroidetes bacterium]|nr:hypothetical protein [Bacteroidota bacterium]